MSIQAHRVIKRIDYVGEYESVCISLDSTSHLYLTEHCIVTHNTYSAARAAVWWYKCHPGSQVYTTAAPPFDNLKKLLWGEIGSVAEKHKDTIFKHDYVSSMHIQSKVDRRSFLTAVAIPTTGTEEQREEKFSGRHAPFLFFIVDEGMSVPEEVYRGIESCMSGGMARLLIMFNPRARMGRVWTLERDRNAKVFVLSAFKHPNVLTGLDLIPGAVTRDKVIERINEWTRPLAENENVPEDQLFKVPDFLIGKTCKATDGRMFEPLNTIPRKIVEPAFSYMVMGEYPAQGDTQLISQEWISRARANWDMWVMRYGEVPPKAVRPVLGGDIAEFGGDANSAVARYGPYVARPRVWTGVDTYETAMRFVTIAKDINAITVHIDASGVGSSIAPFASKFAREQSLDCRFFGVKVANSPMAFIRSDLGEFYQLRDQLWWAMREWLRTDPGAMLPPDEMLIEELSIPSYRYFNGKINTMKKEEMRSILRRSPDRAESLMMTFHPMKRAKITMLGLED